ncbi:MAG: hypothetical protein FIA97_12595 [Methylococcaceae bacterium]|nr:hypothetical protein [Methylococcaceae bacterium]
MLVSVMPLPAALLTAKQWLGGKLFFDTNLSPPPGRACSSCHAPGRAFTDPESAVSSSDGANPANFGSRNAPTAMYMAFSPRFHFDSGDGLYLGAVLRRSGGYPEGLRGCRTFRGCRQSGHIVLDERGIQ